MQRLPPCVIQHIARFAFLFVTVLVVAQPVPHDLLNGLRWRLIGPFRAGRVVAVGGVPGDSKTFYFGAVNGGVWKTTDTGVVWSPIFDGQPAGSVGALAIAPSDPETIYVGTGETDIRSDLSSGNGVYRSIDGGATWTHLGLAETHQISRIVVDSRNPNVVYVGALGHAYAPNEQRGVYKSMDGGAQWTKVLDQGPEIGVSDLAICSGNPRLLFAGTWHTWRPPWSTYAPIDGPGGGLYRSQDAGETWSRLNGKGLPEGEWGRVGVDVAADGKRVYALIQAKKPGLYRSDDSGNTWTLVNADPRLTSRAWYFNSVTIDPHNSDVVYIPNVALYRSEDGGKTITIVRGAPGGDDYHQIWIDPEDSANMALGTDQGATISLDRGQTWSTWYNQPTAQIYHVTTDNQFPYVVYGTQQDSGSVAIPSRTDHGQVTPRDWFTVGPSESGYIVIDSEDPNLVFLTGSYGGVYRFNRRTGLSQDISPWPVSIFDTEIDRRKYRAPWTPVLVASPVDSRALFLGTQYLMKTLDGGLHWEKISPDLTGSAVESEHTRTDGPPTIANAKSLGYGVLCTVAPSYLDRDVIWAGSDTGLIHISRDGGKTWKEVTPKGLTDWGRISMIEASHFDAAVAYAAVDRSIVDDQSPYVYRTRDYGASWQQVSSGISTSAFVRAVREDTQTTGLLFAGTEFGVYISFDYGDHWQSLQLNLPVSSVRDLTIHGDDLVIATHGRSFWILDNITPLRQALQAAAAAEANRPWLFQPATAIRIDNDAFVSTPLPPEEPTAENSPTGAIIDYFLKSPAAKVTLEILDAGQNLVRSFSSDDQSSAQHILLPVAERWFSKPQIVERTPGLHRFIWDLKFGSSGGPSADNEADFHNPSGPKVVPGIYQIRLTADGRTVTRKLEVKMDPRSAATSETLAQQLQLGRQMFLETVEARRALAEINSVQTQLANLQQTRGNQNPTLNSALADAQLSFAKLFARQRDDPEQSPRLQDNYKDLTSVLRAVEGGDRAIPSQAVAAYRESSQQIQSRIAEWTSFKKTKLPQINSLLRAAGVTVINIAQIEDDVELLMSR